MKKVFCFILLLFCVLSLRAALTLNNPIGADGCYIVRWDCANNTWASSNDFEADETFTFAVDITGTQWTNWLSAVPTRGIATNFSTDQGQVARDADRLYHISGNIYGKTINLSHISAVALSLTAGTQLKVFSNIFGFDATLGTWWQEPSEDIVGNSDCFFKTAPYTGAKTGQSFYTNDFSNAYPWINQKGYAAPCVLPETTGPVTPPVTPPDTIVPIDPIDPPVSGSQVYLFSTDQQRRGYYNRPYERYEAEPSLCSTNGSFLAPSEDQRTLQSEASHQQALQLINTNDYVSWVVNKPGDGLTIRFSLPDSESGDGTSGTIAIFAGADKVGELTMFSAWAWQYCSGNYPNNNPKNGPVIRMKFDETHLRLTRPVASGETLKIVKTGSDNRPYTIDFVELEPVPAKTTFEGLSSANKVAFDGNGDVGDFIMNNQGKTIYIPEGRFETSKRIYLRSADGTQVIGAGMWYTEIYFSASSESSATYSYRGFEADNSNLLVDGLYLNTANKQRYYNGDDSKQVGKGFMGCWGSNSVIRNCWVEHFECGAWISDYGARGCNNLLIEHCRFRNNYADGVNCSHGSNGHTIRYCSFRNNGDDDMASWSTARQCSNITYEYCTAENNWRASSLGFFGGKNLTAHHIAIFDALECGARVNSDFQGTGFAADGVVDIHDVTIVHCGCKAGSKGTSGDFWGSTQGAFNVGSTQYYAVPNVHISNLDVLDSRYHAFYLRATGGRKVTDLWLHNVTLDGGTGYGIYYSGVQGSADYCNLAISNFTQGEQTNHMPTFVITECGGGEDLEDLSAANFTLTPTTRIYDLSGRLVAIGDTSALRPGCYILSEGNSFLKYYLSN